MSEPDWWSTQECLDTPLRDLVAGLESIGSLAISYARLPPRLGAYAEELPRWADVASQTPNSLLQRPKLGEAAVRALIEAAQEAVHTSQQAAAGSVGPQAAVARLAARLNEFDRELLSTLIWKPDPPSQHEVALRLGVHSVRVHRHLPRAQARFAELLADPAHREVREHADGLRQRIGPYLPTTVAEAELRHLGVAPDTLTAEVLMHLAGPYRDHEGWLENIATEPGGRAEAAAAISAAFERNPAPSPDFLLQALAAQGMPAEAARAYLKRHVPLRTFGDICVRWTADTTANMAEAALHVLGTPSTAKLILTTIGPSAGKTVHQLNSTLSEDYRFLRASRTTWGLRSWGITEYAGIANAIGAYIDAHGGKADTDQVLDYLLDTYPDVARSSIGTYLSTLEFINTAGVVRRRTTDDEWPEVPPLNTVRGAFHNADNAIRLFLPVNTDILRGSGQAISRSLATALGVTPGQRRRFTNPYGPLAVYWPLASTSGARISSLRAQATAVEATTTDTLVLAFKLDDAIVEVSRVGPDDSARRWAQHLFGRTVTDPLAALAPGLQCQPHEVTAALRARGDHELAAMLENI